MLVVDFAKKKIEILKHLKPNTLAETCHANNASVKMPN